MQTAATVVFSSFPFLFLQSPFLKTSPLWYSYDHPALSRPPPCQTIILIMLKCVKRPGMSFHPAPSVSFNLSPAALVGYCGQLSVTVCMCACVCVG